MFGSFLFFYRQSHLCYEKFFILMLRGTFKICMTAHSQRCEIMLFGIQQKFFANFREFLICAVMINANCTHWCQYDDMFARCFQTVRQHSKKFRWVRTMGILKNTFSLSYWYRIHAWQVLRYHAEYLFYREYFP